jgi:hypothetical protein
VLTGPLRRCLSANEERRRGEQKQAKLVPLAPARGSSSRHSPHRLGHTRLTASLNGDQRRLASPLTDPAVRLHPPLDVDWRVPRAPVSTATPVFLAAVRCQLDAIGSKEESLPVLARLVESARKPPSKGDNEHNDDAPVYRGMCPAN